MTNYTVSVRVDEMGEDTFIETHHETVSTSMSEMFRLVQKYCVNNDNCDPDWAWIDGGDSTVPGHLHATVRFSEHNLEDPDDDNSGWNTDYIIELRENR